MVIHSTTLPVNVLKVIQAMMLLMALLTPAGAAEKDVWQIVFDFQIKLAKQGNAAAQEKVGEMFEEGRGVKQDFTKARYWYTQAANQGRKGAINKLKGLPARIKLSRAKKANTKGSKDTQQQLARKRAAKEKGIRENRLRQQRAAETKKNAREKALREQRAAERKKTAREKALREQRAAERKKAAREKALREQLAEERKKAAREKASSKKNQYSQKWLTKRKGSGAAVTQTSTQGNGQADKKEGSQTFKADPCKSKAARFMSTCKKK